MQTPASMIHIDEWQASRMAMAKRPPTAQPTKRCSYLACRTPGKFDSVASGAIITAMMVMLD